MHSVKRKLFVCSEKQTVFIVGSVISAIFQALSCRSCFIILLALGYSFPARADVMVSNLQDFNFGLYSGNGNLKGNESICINTLPISRYSITFSGSGPAGSFEVFSGANSIPYDVRFNDRKRSGGRRVRPNQPLSNQNGSSDQLNCPGGLNANIQVRFRRRDLQAALPGRYQGKLMIVIAPQ